jgi:2-desacetyl-2-hydroxyethyl bacteriochlorophyllide A dehydrogenase
MSSIQANYVVIPTSHVMNYEGETIETDNIGAFDVLIEAETSVISAGTELANYTGLDSGVHQLGNYNSYPYRPGYGVVGRLVKVGRNITHVREGDRILCMGKHASLQICDFGAASQPYNNAYLIGENIAATTAVMLRMALVAYTAPQSAHIEAGNTVVVFGLGVVGNLAAQLFQLSGARVIGIDTLTQRCDYARRSGIETVLHLQPQEQLSAIRDLTGGKGATIAVDAVGHSKSIENAVFACADYGQVVLLGSPRAAVTMNVTPMLSHIHLHYLTMRGALEWQNPAYTPAGSHHTINGNVQRLLQFVAAGKLNLDSLISHKIDSTQLPDTFAALAKSPQDYMGVVVNWQ